MPEQFSKNFLAIAAKYTNGNLVHQNQAFDWVQSLLTDEELATFADVFRQNPESLVKQDSVILPKFPLLSQRDVQGDFDKDGTLDKYQTCNITCCAMVIQYLTGVQITPSVLRSEIQAKFGSRYVHSNLVKLLKVYGVKSTFDVSVSHEEIKQCLSEGNPVIWSNKLTRSGHIVVLTGYDDSNRCYRVHDPYGEPHAIAGTSKTQWTYEDTRKPYYLSYKAFDTVNANGVNYYRREHWAHLCQKL